jgi:NAD(P)-dependent dehydrogenase (short-subunit alcohol dehydrogenase family)
LPCAASYLLAFALASNRWQQVLVARNAKVYLAARSEERAQAAIDDIRRSTGKSNIHFLHLDLADLASVRKAAEEYMSKEQELHVLINNG